MTKPLGIIELLTRVGEDKVQIRNINGGGARVSVRLEFRRKLFEALK